MGVTEGATDPSSTPDAWRESVRLGMLTAAAFIGPPVVTAALLLRSGQSSSLDDVFLLATGVLLPVYRLMPGALATRSLLMLATACTTSIFLLGRIGLTAGLSVRAGNSIGIRTRSR